MTVFFADIKGSTAWSNISIPKKRRRLLDPVLRVMRTPFTDTREPSIRCWGMESWLSSARRLRTRITLYAPAMQPWRCRRICGAIAETRPVRGIGIKIGIGINSGEVVVRSISNDLNMDYSALGHTTHLAARMQELAAGGVTLMTASTLRQVEGFVQVKAVGGVQVKGVSRPVEAFEVVAATTARTRVQATAVSGLTPLVGRRVEIEVFSKLVEQAASGKGQILAMVGEPGMGKSRLVHEFTRHQLRPGWLVLEGASVSYGKATPYFRSSRCCATIFKSSMVKEAKTSESK